MSLVQTCADAESAITHARSLFGAPGGIDVPNSATGITDAAHTATAGRDRTVDMAGGAGMPAYRDMVDRFIPPLTTAAASDGALTTQLSTAAALSTAGATQLDSIAAHTRTMSAAAPTARTAADQRAVLTALRDQLQQASQVVQTNQQQGGGAATEIRSLKYPTDTPGSSGDRVHGVDDAIAGGQQTAPWVAPAGFGPGGAPLDPAPAPTPPPPNQPGTAPFLPAFEQAVTAPGSAVPPGGPPLPLSPPPNSPASAPPQFSAACQAAITEQQEDQEKKILADIGKGAVAGGLAGVTLDGVGALPGLISGGAIGGIGGVIDWATSPHPLPPACK